jgi:hypothetical protein
VLVRLRNDALIGWVQRGGWRRLLAGWCLRRMHAVIGVSRALCAAAQALGVDAQRVHHFPGFLPPEPGEFERHGVSERVWRFLDAHEPILAANGKVNFHAGADLYGFDHLVELTQRLRPAYPAIGTVICFADHRPADEGYVEQLRASARARGVESNILFATEGGALLPVLDRTSVFIRPTNTDGDANSLREALALSVPAVASDVVERPEGTVLFRTRDLDDLTAQVRDALSRAPRTPRTGARELSTGDRDRAGAYVTLLAGALDLSAARGTRFESAGAS